MATEKSAATRGSKGREPRRRNEEARLSILGAADELLIERGFGSVTVEGIAARAGVSKQTIYRWWPSKFEILMDTLLEDAESALAVPDTGSFAGDLRQHLRQLADFLSAQPAGRVLLALIGQAQHDAGEARAFQQRFGDERRARDRVIFERALARGDIAPGADLDLLADLADGPLYHRVLLTGLPLDGVFIDGLVDRVLASVSRPARSSS